MQVFPQLKKKIANTVGLSLHEKRYYTIETAEKSLHASLKNLNTDYLDIFFLHEPTI